MKMIGKSILIVGVLLLVSLLDTTLADMKNSLELMLVQVNFRHGIRTPSKFEANIVNVNDPTIYGSGGFGQLTNEGKYQSYRLGQLLLKEYDNFLGKYEPNQLYAYASKYDRTKMTIQLVLAGLYPPLEEDIWHPTLKWNPIPFDTASNLCDPLLTPHQCTNYATFFKSEIDQSQEYQKEIAKYQDLFEYIEEMAKVPFKSNITYYSGWSNYAFKIHKLMNLPLPQWCTNDVANRMSDAFKFILDSMSMTEKLKRLNGGTMVRQVIENIEKNRNVENPKKLYLYSHHDLTLAAFERAQGMKIFDIPPFGSAIILEKYRDDNDVEYVRFLAWDGEDDKFFVVKFNGYEEFCPYEEYTKIVKHSISTDEDLEFLVSGN